MLFGSSRKRFLGAILRRSTALSAVMDSVSGSGSERESGSGSGSGSDSGDSSSSGSGINSSTAPCNLNSSSSGSGSMNVSSSGSVSGSSSSSASGSGVSREITVEELDWATAGTTAAAVIGKTDLILSIISIISNISSDFL